MDKEKRDELEVVMQRIRKLLALGTSPNEHEAALASAKAQELLAKYDLTMESIDDLKSDSRTSIRTTAATMKTTEGKPDGWKADLFHAVAHTSDCFVIFVNEYEKTKSGKYRTVKHGKLIGFGHDVEMAGYVYHFLVGEIERLGKAYSRVMWDEINAKWKAIQLQVPTYTHAQAESEYVGRTGRHPLKAELYFIRGASETVITKIRHDWYLRQRTNKADNPHAVVLDKRRAIEDHRCREQHGMGIDQYEAEQEAKSEEWQRVWQANHSMEPLSASEQRRQEEIRQRKRDRQAEAQRNREIREHRKMDHNALRAGRDAGQKVDIRKGISDGPDPKGHVS